MKKQQWLGSGMLLLAAMIWGCAFVAQSVAMEHIGPFTFGGLRFALGGLALLPVIALRKRQGLPFGSGRDLLLGGVLCGAFLFFASAAQQIGLMYTTVGKSGFITALYVVLVPVAGLLFFRRRVSPLLILSVVAAVGGLYLLCGQTGFSLNKGDVYTFFCALLFTGHIMTVDSFVERVDGVQLSCVQFFVCAILNGVAALITEPPVTLPMIAASWLPMLYTGLLSSGVAYTFQILGQKRTPPAVASLLMSLESVFAVLAGAILLGQWLNTRETMGCCLMFAAVLVAQIPTTTKQKRTSQE